LLALWAKAKQQQQLESILNWRNYFEIKFFLLVVSVPVLVCFVAIAVAFGISYL